MGLGASTYRTEVATALLDLAQGRLREGGGDRSRLLTVGGELDGAGAVDLLEAAGGELEEARTQLLRLREGRADGRADQRKALLSLSKKPASWW